MIALLTLHLAASGRYEAAEATAITGACRHRNLEVKGNRTGLPP